MLPRGGLPGAVHLADHNWDGNDGLSLKTQEIISCYKTSIIIGFINVSFLNQMVDDGQGWWYIDVTMIGVSV